jgi:NhaA family Na+:H+ antiporter
VTPTFYINGRRYEGPWDENALAEVRLGSLGHRIQSAALDFVRWGPSTGLLLLLMTVLAVLLTNTQYGPAFEAFWQRTAGVRVGSSSFELSLIDWINHGLLTIFFLVVGLEIKREFTVGHLSRWRAATLPLAASVGGMVVPALLYLAIVPPGPLMHGWGIPIATDTAFAIALIVLLRDRVPVELRVFLTATVIVDDLAAIVIIAVFYSTSINLAFLLASVLVTVILAAMNRWQIYRPLPYFIAGVILWVCLHDAGIHATLAGVILAVFTPTRPPGNLRVLLTQAENILQDEVRRYGAKLLSHGPSVTAMRAMDAIFDRVESPADKLLRTLEPWSSYFVLPIFALANAGVAMSREIIEGHRGLVMAIVVGLAVGKPVGIGLASWLTVRLGLGEKPDEYSWRQLVGAGALAGIGFTMSLFIASQAFPVEEDFAAAKIAVFAASILAGVIGVAILWKRRVETDEEAEARSERFPERDHSPAFEL